MQHMKNNISGERDWTSSPPLDLSLEVGHFFVYFLRSLMICLIKMIETEYEYNLIYRYFFIDFL